jgi:transcription initiation factor TFIIB
MCAENCLTWDAFANLKNQFSNDMKENEEVSEDDEIYKCNDLYEYNNKNEKNKNIDICLNCNKKGLLKTDIVIVCDYCGYENDRVFDFSNESRYYGIMDTKHASDPSRCGIPINELLPNSSLGTMISGRGFEKFRRVPEWNLMSQKERSLLKTYKSIDNYLEDGGISNRIIDRAKFMFKDISANNKIRRGDSLTGLMSACCYLSCKDKNVARSTKEMSKMFDIKENKVSNGYKEIMETLYHSNKEYVNRIDSVSHYDFIYRYCNKLNIDKEYVIIAMYVSNIADKLSIVVNNKPPSIAIGSIYFVLNIYNLKFTKKTIAKVCNISDVTISKTYEKLVKQTKFLIPNKKDMEEFLISHKDIVDMIE